MKFKSMGSHLIVWLVLALIASALFLSFFYRPHTFGKLIQEPIISLETRDSGNGKFYKTDDKLLTAQYEKAMESMTFRKKMFPVPEFTGGSSIDITDAKGVIHSIRSGPGDTYSIDGVWYKASRSKSFDMAWKQFSQNFYKDSNYVPQK